MQQSVLRSEAHRPCSPPQEGGDAPRRGAPKTAWPEEKASRLQFSQAGGPRKLTSDESLRHSRPEELKHPSGTPRDGGGSGGRFGIEAWASIIWESMRASQRGAGPVWLQGQVLTLVTCANALERTALSKGSGAR